MRHVYPAIALSFLFLFFSLRSFGQSQSVLATGVNHPLSIYMDKSGRLFYTNGNTVQIFSSTLFAGTGVAGSSGDGGPATSAQLNQPYGIYEDPDGNVYIGTRGDNKIRKVATDGTISTFAGNGTGGYSGDGGPATQASLAGINGLYGDPYGNIYVSDSIHAVVRKIDTTGKITTIAGTGIPGYSGDGGPAAAAQLYTDKGLAPGVYYYRLQMADQDGHYTYSPIKSVTIGGVMGNLVLYPNPAKDMLYCQVPVTVAGKYIVQLADRDGTVLQTQQASLSPGMTTLSFDISGLAVGVYFITVSDGSHKQTGSFLK